MISDLMFSNSILENQFRLFVQKNSDVEIGGFFLTTRNPRNWPGKFQWGKVKRIVGDRVIFIDNVILVPNESGTPENKWQSWNIERAIELARANAKMSGGWPVHFHSHPAGHPAEPSQADIAFAGAWCKETLSESWFSIVTPYPLRAYLFSVNFGRASVPMDNQLERGEFFSWRQKAVKAVTQ